MAGATRMDHPSHLGNDERPLAIIFPVPAQSIDVTRLIPYRPVSGWNAARRQPPHFSLHDVVPLIP